MNRPAFRRRRGYTLLEVILSLALMSLVLMCVAMAVDFQLRVADAGRSHIEEAQLARVLLHRIADDLRAAVTASAETTATSSGAGSDSLFSESSATGSSGTSGSGTGGSGSGTGGSGTGGSGSGTGGSGSGTGGSGSGTGGSGTGDSSGTGGSGSGSTDAGGGSESGDDTDSASGESGAASGASGSVVPQTKAGVYGGIDWLQVDISRLPRPDQVRSALEPADDAIFPVSLADEKTVAYYLAPPDESTASDPLDPGSWSGGLVRQELDRAVASWASSQGLDEGDAASASPLAPEVVSLEFRYCDGTSWLEDWDTGTLGALPVAIEVTLGIQPKRQSASWASTVASSVSAGAETSEVLYYTLVVDLPAAQAMSSGSLDELMMSELESATMSEVSP